MCVPRVGLWDSKYVDEIFHSDWMKIIGQGFVTSMAFWLFHYIDVSERWRKAVVQKDRERERHGNCA
jgi:hypothetical protein